MKKCSKCLKLKDLFDYHRGNGEDGFSYWCVNCVSDYNSKRYLIKKDKILSNGKRWRENNKDYFYSYVRQWRKDNKEIVQVWCNNRNSRKRLNGGILKIQEWRDMKREYNFRCRICFLKEPKIKLTIDHIVPISKGGLNTIDNIQPLCVSCNSKKGNTIL